MWRLFHATDFESLMYPCFTFCRILGAFPYRINDSTFKPSKPDHIFSIIVICAFCLCELITFYDLNLSKNIVFISVPKMLECNCFHIFSSFIVIMAYIFNGARMRLLQSIMKISSKLPPESYQKLSKLIHTKDILGFVFLIGSAWIYYTNLHFSDLQKLLTLYIVLLMYQIDMLYINCVCIIKACFMRINDNLGNLGKHVINDEPYLSRQIYHEQRNPFLLMELNVLKKEHMMISNTVQMLKVIFGLHLLVTIVMTFTQITFNLYFYLMRIHGGNSMSNQFYYKYFLTCVTYYSIKIILIIWACETGKNEAKKIGITIYDACNSINNKQIKYELQLFSLQLLHRKNVFSARGLIVDATLLAAMGGSITTYLLILIQFWFMSNSCNEK
ncbi:hypothetical protein P5V15_009548 [Pogonomyrmex californicus]